MAMTICVECGHKISTRAASCPSCGHPVQSARHVLDDVTATSINGQLSSSTSMSAMLCGVGGLVMLFLPCAWLLAGLPNVLGIVLGCVAIGKVRRGEATGRGLAVTGLVTGVIGLLLYAGMWLLWQDIVHQTFSE